MQKSKKRIIDVLVISDIHLGTYGCKAKELHKYLKSIKPKKVILNGDILDIWQFKKSYWPKAHMKIIKHIIDWISKGVEVHYITGNHDEMLRKFVGFKIGSFSIENKLVLELNGEKAWFFHGDVFDVTMQYSKWLTKLGSIGYGFLIRINSIVNFFSEMMGKGKISFSKKIKNKVKGAVNFINSFEKVATDIAIENKFDFVICGHIHHPKIEEFITDKGKTTYLNSGDWVENLTSLEYVNNQWQIYTYNEDDYIEIKEDNNEEDILDKTEKEIFNNMLKEFNITYK